LREYPELRFKAEEISGGIMLTFAQSQAIESKSINQTGQVTIETERLLSIIKGEMSRQQLQEALTLSSRGNFDKRYLKPAIELKMIEPTIPDKPNSRLQKYRLTQAGQSQLINQKAKHK